jgi:hypothetical protein
MIQRFQTARSSSSRYARRVGLIACPFCREMFEEGEAKKCPVCEMPLAQLHKLPPSLDAMHDEAGVPTAPELEKMPLTYVGRGKAPIAVLGLIGLGLFFVPWVQMTLPYIAAKSGFDLAKNIGWLWSCLAAWCVLVPTVLSRRSIAQMRGARVAAAFLSAFPGISAAILLLKPPHGAVYTIKYSFDWPIYATLIVSLLAVAFSLRLGGSTRDIKVSRGSSVGQHLH